MEEGLAVLRAVGDMRGKAPKERGKTEIEERDDTSGGEILDVGTDRLRGSELLGGIALSLDIPEASVVEEEDVEEEEEEGGLLLDAGVLP